MASRNDIRAQQTASDTQDLMEMTPSYRGPRGMVKTTPEGSASSPFDRRNFSQERLDELAAQGINVGEVDPNAAPEIQAPGGLNWEAAQVAGGSTSPTPDPGSAPMAPDDTTQQQGPDYSRRDLFEQAIFKQLGGNPFEIDPRKEAQVVDAKLPELFDHIFRGSVTWSDRHLLDKDQRNYWNQTVKQFHADAYNEAASRKKQGIDMYKFMTGKFDREAKAEEARRKEAAAEPKMRRILNESGKMEWMVWDPSTKAYKPTGMGAEKPDKPAKGPGEPKRTDVEAIYKFEQKQMKDLDPGVPLPPDLLVTFNRMRRAAGMPELEEKTSVGESQGWWAQQGKKWLGIKPDDVETTTLEEVPKGGAKTTNFVWDPKTRKLTPKE